MLDFGQASRLLFALSFRLEAEFFFPLLFLTLALGLAPSQNILLLLALQALALSRLQTLLLALLLAGQPGRLRPLLLGRAPGFGLLESLSVALFELFAAGSLDRIQVILGALAAATF